MRKIINITVGISIVLGVVSGYVFSNEKYFYLSTNQPKREITEETSKLSEIRGAVKKERVYNKGLAWTVGLVTLGLGIIISSKQIQDE